MRQRGKNAGKALASSALLSLVWTGCFFAPGSDHGGATPECTTDAQCEATPSCRGWRCEQHQCNEHDLPDGSAAPDFVGTQQACQRIVCDGHGSTRAEPDPAALPTGVAPACQRYACDASGHAVLSPDPTHTPSKSESPCQSPVCDAAGNVSYEPDPANTPADTPHDCQLDQCAADGSITKVVNDSDLPEPSTCYSYGCSGGQPVSTPINPDKTCASEGYVCGADGSCSTCPAPGASCSDPGPGSRSATSAHDFGGIGRTDSGGRWFCGAVPSGQTEYYTYYDDETGFLAEFDPYFEINPQAPVQMCVYFDCPSVTCPSNWTSDTSAGHPGCCLQAVVGSFSGGSIDFCAGARVDIQVETLASCAAYELHFHD